VELFWLEKNTKKWRIFQHAMFDLVSGLNPSEKYDSQLGWLFPTEWKNNPNDPNHQPVDYLTVIQI
jgi:hypothetical protein